MPKALKSCPKSKKSPNLVTLLITIFMLNEGDDDEIRQSMPLPIFSPLWSIFFCPILLQLFISYFQEGRFIRFYWPRGLTAGGYNWHVNVRQVEFSILSIVYDCRYLNDHARHWLEISNQFACIMVFTTWVVTIFN